MSFSVWTFKLEFQLQKFPQKSNMKQHNNGTNSASIDQPAGG